MNINMQKKMRQKIRKFTSIYEAKPESCAKMLEQSSDLKSFRRISKRISINRSPADLKEIYELINKDNMNVAFKDAVQYLPMYQQALRSSKLPKYSRKKLVGPHFFLESDNSIYSEKTLLVLFPSFRNELFFPLPRLLMSLPESKVDVCVLNYWPGANYHMGLPKIGTTLKDSLLSLSLILKMDLYKRVVFYGDCLGGYPALFAAELLRGDVGISVSGRMREFSKQMSINKLNYAFEPLCECRFESKTKLINYYGADNVDDSFNASVLKMVRPYSETIPINGVAEHNVYIGVAAIGGVKGFLDRLAKSIIGE